MSARKGKVLGGLAAAMLAMAGGVVAVHEGYVPATYADPIGIPTVCYGHTGAGVVAGKTYTHAECQTLLDGDVRKAFVGLQACIHRDLPAHEWAALVSWAYNVGTGAACASTLVRQINAGQPADVFCAELSRWVYAGGRPLPGLVTRRAHERALCEEG